MLLPYRRQAPDPVIYTIFDESFDAGDADFSRKIPNSTCDQESEQVRTSVLRGESGRFVLALLNNGSDDRN